MKKIKVRLLKGLAGCKQSHRDTVRGLGLRKINSVKELEIGRASCRERVSFLV